MDEDDLYFKLAAPDDLELVHKVYCDVCLWLNDTLGIINQWDREVSKEEIQELIGSGELYLAMLQDEVAGAFRLNGHDRHWDDDGTALYVHAFAVNRKFKGQGIGQVMLDWAAKEARRRGKKFLRLDCTHENARLKWYYREAGFALQAQHPHYPWSALLERKLT